MTIANRFGDAIVEEVEPDVGIKKAEQLLSSNLSGSQLDLFMHGDGDPFAPGHVKPKPNENRTNQSDQELNRMFLESETNGISSKFNSKRSDEREFDEPITETSTL